MAAQSGVFQHAAWSFGYLVGHERNPAELLLKDDATPYFRETVLQAIWNEQCLFEDMTSESGQKLQVLHPGIWNVSAGPDFAGAILVIDGVMRRGAVEIHFHPEDWMRHGHDRNASYADVILHVVWKNPAGHSHFPSGIPVLSLATHLDQPLDEVLQRIDINAYPYARKVGPGTFAREFAAMSDAKVEGLLRERGESRILRKARRLGERIEEHGMEEAVFRRLMETMGYGSNRAAFAELAACVPLSELAECTADEALALLFGAGGLLPDPARTPVLPEHQARVQEMWAFWWARRRPGVSVTWHGHRQRPYNHPNRRIVAAVLLCCEHRCRLGEALMAAMGGASESPRECLRALRACLRLASDEAWRGFRTFTQSLKVPAAVLGPSRVDDLIVNLALPLYLAVAVRRGDADMFRAGIRVLRQMPRLQRNRSIEEAVHQFLVPPSRARDVLTGACTQQGMMQLYEDTRLLPPAP